MPKHIVSIILLGSLFSGINIIPESSSIQPAKFKDQQKISSGLTAQKEPKEIVPGKGRRNEENKAQSNHTQSINEFV